MRALALLGLSTALACGGSMPPSAVPRPVGEDLLALVPSGAELVVDLDLLQVRSWDETERLLQLLPPAAKARLDRLGPQWLGDLDALALASWRGTSGAATVLVLRGDLDDTKLPGLLEAEAVRSTLDGHTMYEASGEAVIRLAPRLVAVGSPVEVRRVLEVSRAESQGLRDARGDAALRDALQHAPSAKIGRPALLGAAIGGPLLNERLASAGFARSAPQWAAFAIALGDGVDAVVVLGLSTPAEATSLRTELDRSLRDLRTRPVVRLLHLEAAFDWVSVARDRQLRVAYRLPGEKLAAVLAQLDKGRRALDAMKAQPPAP